MYRQEKHLLRRRLGGRAAPCGSARPSRCPGPRGEAVGHRVTVQPRKRVRQRTASLQNCPACHFMISPPLSLSLGTIINGIHPLASLRGKKKDLIEIL